MDLVKLGEDFLGTELVQGERSLIWSERYADAGDFQLETLRVEETKAQIPEGSYVGLMDSDEVMIVEEHSVDADPETGADLLMVRGRTFETLGEQRMTYRLPASGSWTIQYYPELVDSNMSAIVGSFYTERLGESAVLNLDPRNRVANYGGMQNHVDFSVHITEELVDYKAPVSDIYSICVSYLKAIGAGVRNRRILQRPEMTGWMYSEIYAGADRTVNQNDRDPVIFTTMQDHLLDARYLWTLRNYKNFAQVVSPIYQLNLWAPGVDTSQVGKNVRILHVDASDITSAGSGSPSKLVRQRGLAELAKHNQIFFFEGEISPASPYKRGSTPIESDPGWGYEELRRTPPGDYDLGDLVTLMGKYGVSQTMRVTEFVRTQDQTGYREFPTLSQPVLETS